jgi:teichuronic acid biosynthesis glycosyltransferase TuaC
VTRLRSSTGATAGPPIRAGQPLLHVASDGRDTSPAGTSPRVFVLTNMWPTDAHPHYGVWIESHVRAVVERGVSVRVRFVNARRTRWAYARSALRIVLLNFEPRRYDLLHAQSGYAGALALLQIRIPVLISFMGSCDLLRESGHDGRVALKSRVAAAVSRQLARFSDRTITMTSEMERALPASVRPRNWVLPHGVDRSLFRPIPRAVARARLGWGSDERVVLFVGHTENKRFDLALEAVHIARSERPDLQLKRLAHGPQRDVPVWMNAADVLIVTSNVEGSPNMVKEAMACGLPIVSVDVGDVHQVIAGTRNCHITERDPRMLAVALLEVFNAAPERSDGRPRSEHLALPVIAERLVSIYRETITTAARNRTRPPSPGRRLIIPGNPRRGRTRKRRSAGRRAHVSLSPS